MPSAIELEIMKHGPVEAAFTVYQGEMGGGGGGGRGGSARDHIYNM